MASSTWGEWMGAWKAEAGKIDEEQDRLSRQAAAFGGETLGRMKDLNILIIGCRGVGVECAKNLILCNVGSVTVWDKSICIPQDLGTNFYLNESSIGKPIATGCLRELKSLNPYCKVEALDVEADKLIGHLSEANVLSTGRGYSVVVVTQLLSRELLIGLNNEARGKGIAYLFAANMGATTSLFSDFGPKHLITDEDGEPGQMLAVSAAEVITVGGIVKIDGTKDGDRIVVLTLAAEHSMQDGDIVALDDMRGDLAAYNGKHLKVKRFGISSPTEAKMDLKDVAVKEMLKSPTGEVLSTYTKQYDFYKAAFDKSGADGKFKAREITLFNRLCLILEEGHSVDDFTAYRSGGLINTVKPHVNKEYESLEKTLVSTPNPQMLDQEAWHAGEGCWVHIALAAALKFHEEMKAWPGLRDEAHAKKFVEIAKAIGEERKTQDGACWFQKVEWGFPSGEPAENLEKIEACLRRFSLCFQAELTGLCAFLGGVIAQEVIKKTGKFTPMDQWVHHDDALLFDPSGKAGKYEGTRYAGQAAVCGEQFMEKIRAQKIFLVGVGALGCEYIKGLALMGACTAEGSKLIVTDMDRIEVSNLSRQFLFRTPDVGKPKSVSAARVVKGWNPELKVEALEKGVGTTSEDFFDDEFWSGQDLCWNALDNVIARKYTDKCCLWYGLPLLESGTLGTKSNSDVFLPHLTKSYNDGTEDDGNENQIAMCTLRSFPFLPLHCIEFAKQAYFSDYFDFAPSQYEAFRKDPSGFFEQLEAMSDADKFKSLQMIKGFIELQQAGTVDFNICVKTAFNHYCKDFVTSVRDLVYNCDQLEKSSGKPFWTGTKRRPVEAPWSPSSPPAEALEYLYATANCYAFIWKVPFVRNREDFQKLVVSLNLSAPEWLPPGDGKVESEEDDDNDKADPEAIEALKGELYAQKTEGLHACQAHDFEKDDDCNFHIDFLTISTNLRAKNYDIKQSERAHVKVTAGRIIPALATTTAMICGLVDIEFMKLVKGCHKEENPLDKFYNANVNLATGSVAMNVFRPEPAIKKETKLTGLTHYTTWEKVDIQGEMTVKELVTALSGKFGGGTLHRIFPAGNDKFAIFDAAEILKQDWKIEISDDGKVTIEPEEVYNAWPQLRMASQNFSKMPEGNARKNFENQIRGCAKSLQSVKDTFTARYNGEVSKAYVAKMRPSDEKPEDQKYFDAVFEKRPYLALHAHLTNAAGEDADVPLIKYRRIK